MQTSWYREWFDRHEYELVYQARNAREAEHVIDLIIELTSPPPEASIIDIGCGRGRHAIELARRGFDVTGIDLSGQSVEEARRRAQRAGVRVTFERRDMREPYCKACMDLVLNLFTAFGYFADEEDHLRAVCSMAENLRTGGFIVQDFLNEDLVRRSFVPEDQAERNGVHIRQLRWIDHDRINKRIMISKGDERREFFESVRLFSLDDFRAMYEHCGLEIVHTLGSYDGEPYSADSPRLILVGRRA
ncbi:MAG: SAM-dependent methyltransferase [Bacteroidota bacterium]